MTFKPIRRAICAVMLVLELVACATAGKPPVVYQAVEKPVAVSCIPPNLGPAPAVHTPPEIAAMSGPERYVAVAADYLTLFARSLEAEPTISACGSVANAGNHAKQIKRGVDRRPHQ